MRIRLKVNNVDLSASNLLRDEWEIERSSFGGIDTASFTLDDPTNSLTLTELSSVTIEDWDDSNNGQFGGLLTGIVQFTVGLGRRFRCQAHGWVFDLEKATVTDIYRGASDQEVILNPSATATKPKGIFLNTEKDLAAYTFTTATIKEGNSNTQKLVFQGENIRDIMDLLAEWTGFVWGVLPDQTVFYRPMGEQVHAFSLSDSPDDVVAFPYRGFVLHRDSAKRVNAVIVIGGRIREKDQTKIYKGDGATLLYRLGLDWRAKDSATDKRLEVEKNTGTDVSPSWTAQTVGLPQEPGSFDVIWDEIVATLEFTSPPPDFANSFRVIGDVWRPVIGDAVDQASIDAVGRFELTIKDVTLTDDDAVERRATIELNRRSAGSNRITIVTDHDGLEPGKLIRFVNTIHDIDRDYLVESLVMRGIGPTLEEYEVVLRRVVV